VATVENRLQGGTNLCVIRHRTLQGIALAPELLDVATRSESLLSVAAQDDTAHLIVGGQLADHCGQGLPHRQVERVALARIRQGDGRDGVLARAENAPVTPPS
jgi:hypothetical protein